MTELNSHVGRVSPMFNSPMSGTDVMDSASIKPVRYRYVMTYLQETVDAEGVTHQPGEVMAILPMTSVTYGVGFYSGTELNGNVYLPEMWLDLMSHQPSNDYERIPHPDRSGIPVGAMFECGNRALYVMRNDDVVWGGILWTRQYTSGTPALQITALSWDGYAYYRALRKSIVFYASTSVYNIWRTVLNQMLHDFTLSDGVPKDGKRQLSTKVVQYVVWTGISRVHANADARNFEEAWPYNSPNIDLPPANLVWKTGAPATEVKTTDKSSFRGYDMNKVGEALQQWADTETLASSTAAGAKTRFEYRVVCWFDSTTQLFRQRYVFGEMTYGSDPNTPTGITSGLMGKNTRMIVDSDDNKLIFDFPGHISEWSLGESMEESATRVITVGAGDEAAKHAEYWSEKSLLKVPDTPAASTGKRGWRLYDRVSVYDTTSSYALLARAKRILELCHVPQALQLSDLAAANTTSGQRASKRSTDLTITLYTDPTTPFPDWKLGDWATFAIEDPFYGGKMYLQRRIIGYTVTVIPEQENDYSHEQITLDLTDDTKIAES